jgi:hypothetical protein
LDERRKEMCRAQEKNGNILLPLRTHCPSKLELLNTHIPPYFRFISVYWVRLRALENRLS